MAKIIAVCKSDGKGTKKEVIARGVIREDYGLIGDAHADCCTHRQGKPVGTRHVSLFYRLSAGGDLLTFITSAKMLTAISSGVWAYISRPMGAWTLSNCSRAIPLASK